jgi:hypothetical protein
MGRSKTPSHILELEIQFDAKNPASVLEHLSNSARSVYNACLGECVKRMNRLIQDPEYDVLKKEYVNAKRKGLPVKDLRDRYKALNEKHGYTEYSLHAYAAQIRKHFPNFGIDESQKQASRAFQAVERLRRGQAEKVRFHSKHEPMSFEGKSSRSKLHYDLESRCLKYGEHLFRLKVKPNDQYAMLCLMDEVKYVRVLKRVIRGRERWFCQLVLKGLPPDGQRHKPTYANESAGIDPGVSTMAFVSDTDAKLFELAPDCAEDEKAVRRIQRAMERSRRATNPDNYNPDGTIKKGNLTWNYSKRYIRLSYKLKELFRQCKVRREVSHHILAKIILSKASFLKTEDMSYRGLAKRSKKTKKNKSNGKNVSKKRYGKTVHARAPARLIAILDQKLSYRGRSVERVDTRKVRASQYNPLDGTYQKKDLRDRMVSLGENAVVQRDLLSAYCIKHTVITNDFIHPGSAYADFRTFKWLNDREVSRLRETHTLSWYTS